MTADRLALTLPPGWRSTQPTPGARTRALYAEPDPAVQRFLRTRLEPLTAQGAVLYLYDVRRVATDRLATVEVYRYPAGRTPQQVVDQVLLPRYQQAGLSPVAGRTILPAGVALTVSGTLARGSVVVRTTSYVLPLGPTAVGLSATAVGPPRGARRGRAQPARRGAGRGRRQGVADSRRPGAAAVPGPSGR